MKRKRQYLIASQQECLTISTPSDPQPPANVLPKLKSQSLRSYFLYLVHHHQFNMEGQNPNYNFDTSIRDCLILAITDACVQNYIKSFRYLTSEEILCKVEAIEKESKLWSLILPWISPTDLLSLFFSSPRMTLIIRTIIGQSGQFSIDAEMLRKYPTRTITPDLLDFGQQVWSLSINGITEEAFQKLKPYFTKITHLTLTDMEINSSNQHWPKDLKELSITNSSIPSKKLSDWIYWKKLEKLHLENLYFGYNPMMRCPQIEIKGALLSDLTLIGDSLAGVKIGAQNLHNLKIVLKIPLTHGFYQSRAQNIYYDGPAMKVNAQNIAKTLSLTIRTWGGMSNASVTGKLPAVIKIIDPVDVIFEEEIRGFPRRTLIECSFAGEPSPILDCLNDDCLFKIAEYLRGKELINFSLCNSRINHLLKRKFYARVKVSPNCTQIPPHFHDNAKFTRTITVNNTPHSTHWKPLHRNTIALIPHFDNLTTLLLCDIKIQSHFCQFFPKNINKLGIENCHITEGDHWKRYLIRVNPTLRSLEWNNCLDDHLILLTNLRELKIQSNFTGDHLEKFFKANGASLECIAINEGCAESLLRIWKVIGSLSKLDHLILTESKQTDGYAALNAKAYNDRMFSHLRKLRKLSVISSEKRLRVLIKRIPGETLEELSLKSTDRPFLDEGDFLNFKLICSLRKLDIGPFPVPDLDVCIGPVLRNLPLLHTLNVAETFVRRELREILLIFLKVHKRTLKCDVLVY